MDTIASSHIYLKKFNKCSNKPAKILHVFFVEVETEGFAQVLMAKKIKLSKQALD